MPPRRVAAVALAIPPGATPGWLPPDVLSGTSMREPCLLVPDPDGPGQRELLEARLRTWPVPDAAITGPTAVGPVAAVGPVVPLGQAADSLRWARRALDLARHTPAWPTGRVIRCDDHLAIMMLLADADLAGIQGVQALAPLRGLRPENSRPKMHVFTKPK